MLKDMGFQEANLKGYDRLEEYAYALSNGQVSAIFDELPYLKLFLVKHWYPLLPLVSKALLEVTENKLDNISNTWLGREADCSSGGSGSRSGRLSLDSFLGLFLIAGVSSTSALIIYLFIFLYENRDMLLSDASIHQKLSAIARTFHQEKQEELTNAPKDDDDFLVIENNITNPPPTPENHQVSDDDEAEATTAHDGIETRN
ncbi:hypothetical protein L1987_47740 [Smallanthus sonchifolius]|uniref:Uncharacterized protein n=1 Tax=Smallanthus sonchifolius TaxID=185202 RepID=A0ACB9G3F4_9ASTR|nr:hypothetical protein L1987_47740 [Smallanthus sonchifolius]